MLHFLKLIRPLNLLIIVFTMYMMRYFVIASPLWNDAVNPEIWHLQTSNFDFFLLVLSSVLIAAAGYIINDYFDIKIDRINKPKQLIVGKYIKKRWAMLFHVLLNSFAVLIGLYLTIKYHNLFILGAHLFTTTVLWLYSLSLKRQLLIGNISIALLSSLVVLLVGWFELKALLVHYNHAIPNMPFSASAIYNLTIIIWLYAFFAGFTTLIREIIKDLADQQGDEANHCKTLPIVLGKDKTRWVVVAMIFLFTLSLYLIIARYLPHEFVFLYFTGLVILPAWAAAYLCWYKKSGRKGFLAAGNLLKFAMFSGVLFAYFIKDYVG